MPFRIIQISDLHLFADPKGELLGVNTQESLEAVINLLQAEKKPFDLIFLSGDLSQDASSDAYIRIAEMMKSFQVPTYYVPGNHDDIKVMSQVYPRETISNHKHIILKNWHLILLNSQKPNAVEGYLDASQLNYLLHCLQTYPEHHAMIVFHHQPIPVGCVWLDNLGIQNAEDFWEVMKQHPKAKTVLFGHVHQEFDKEYQGVNCIAAPSTCIQFKRTQPEFGLEFIPPGYRLIELFEDGHIETTVKRVPSYVGEFNEDAKGY